MSSNEIANGILYFASNAEKIEEQGEINKERVKKFSWDESGKKLNNIYNLLKNKNKDGK
jgi:glycosyltransferase involved in cell wall biosynthesis